MKSRTVKQKIKRIVELCGNGNKARGIELAAQKLEIHWTYVYKLSHGKKPGRRLYKDICALCDELEKLKNE